MKDLAYVRENIEEIRKKINKLNKNVKLLAVTKNFSAGHIIAAIECGVTDFGESKLQEAEQKIDELKDRGYRDIKWHFIGHLQSNKASKITKYFDMIQSVDSLKVAQKINEAAQLDGKIIPVLLEYKTSEEETKFGAGEKEIFEIAGGVAELGNIKVKGLLTMAPFFDAPEKARPYFKAARLLLEKLKKEYKGNCFDLKELSMGMTGDFEAAIQEGATMVRIGTGIFGERKY